MTLKYILLFPVAKLIIINQPCKCIEFGNHIVELISFINYLNVVIDEDISW